MLFNSVYKGNYIQVSDENTRIIDPSDILARRLANTTSHVIGDVSQDSAEMPYGDMDALEGDGLSQYEEDGQSSFQPGLNAPEINTENALARCQEMIDKASVEADGIIENARLEAENIFEEAKRNGYEAGFSEAVKNLEAEYQAKQQALKDREAELEQQYSILLQEAEPKMAEAVIDAFEHVFGNSLYDNKDVFCNLISRALADADDKDAINIHVSTSDYDVVNDNREEFIPKGKYSVEPEIRRHDDYAQGTVKIETSGGIVDCSIDTEFEELKKAIILLAGER